MISFLRLTPSDAPLLAAIGSASLLQSHGHSAPPHVMQAYVEAHFSEAACAAELQEAQNIFHAVVYNGQPAGYSKIIFGQPHPAVPSGPATKLERLYLLRDFYGVKLGDRLLQNAIELSKKWGERGMWLNVWKENGRAISFYRKWGFETVGESAFVLTAEHANPNWVMLLLF